MNLESNNSQLATRDGVVRGIGVAKDSQRPKSSTEVSLQVNLLTRCNVHGSPRMGMIYRLANLIY
jgi:hypothetical protein